MGELGGIGAGVALGDFHLVLFVEVTPVVGDLSCGIVERHGDRLEDELPVAVDKGELDELRAVNVVVVRQIEPVVGAPQVASGVLDGASLVGFLHTTDDVVAFLSSQGVEWGGDDTAADGLDDAVFRDDDGHMVYHGGGNVGDGVGVRRDVEQQVALPQGIRLAAGDHCHKKPCDNLLFHIPFGFGLQRYKK